jgi:hypothetical protein
MRRRFVAMIGVGLVVACGPPHAGDVCRKIAAVTCQNIFRCNEFGASAYASESDCQTKTLASAHCEALDSCTADLSQYSKCLDDSAMWSCNATTSPASCMNIDPSAQLPCM